MLERIQKLDESIQEYIMIGLRLGIFNDSNIDRVLSRLERVRFSVDNQNPGDAQTEPIRNPQNVRVSNGISVKINEKKTYASDKYYFRDEVVFHELTHCINGFYENWFENLSLWYDFDKIFKSRFFVKDDRLSELSSLPEYRQRAYSWLVLDEFVAQYVAQLFVEAKYGRVIYGYEDKKINQSNPNITVHTNFADYPEFYELVSKFIETIYGRVNMSQFIQDSMDYTIIDKIFSFFQNKNNGFNTLYSLLGEMGNIGFAVASRNFTPGQCRTDSDMQARDPRRFYSHYQECLSIMDSIMNQDTFIPGIKGHF